MKKDMKTTLFALLIIALVVTLTNNVQVHASSSAARNDEAKISKDGNDTFNEKDGNGRLIKAESERKGGGEKNNIDENSEAVEKNFIQTWWMLIVAIFVFILLMAVFIYRGKEFLVS